MEKYLIFSRLPPDRVPTVSRMPPDHSPTFGEKLRNHIIFLILQRIYKIPEKFISATP